MMQPSPFYLELVENFKNNDVEQARSLFAKRRDYTDISGSAREIFKESNIPLIEWIMSWSTLKTFGGESVIKQAADARNPRYMEVLQILSEHPFAYTHLEQSSIRNTIKHIVTIGCKKGQEKVVQKFLPQYSWEVDEYNEFLKCAAISEEKTIRLLLPHANQKGCQQAVLHAIANGVLTHAPLLLEKVDPNFDDCAVLEKVMDISYGIKKGIDLLVPLVDLDKYSFDIMRKALFDKRLEFALHFAPHFREPQDVSRRGEIMVALVQSKYEDVAQKIWPLLDLDAGFEKFRLAQQQGLLIVDNDNPLSKWVETEDQWRTLKKETPTAISPNKRMRL